VTLIVERRDDSMKIGTNIIPHSQVCLLALVLLAAVSALPLFAETNVLAYGQLGADEIIQVYDEIERELLVRFDRQKAERSQRLSETIEALGHIHSREGMDRLLANIDIRPETYPPPDGQLQFPLQSGASSLQGLYVAFRVLEHTNIVPVERIIQEAEAAVPNSKREAFLVLLGYSCHADAFSQYAKERKKTKPSTTDWESIYQQYRGHLQ